MFEIFKKCKSFKEICEKIMDIVKKLEELFQSHFRERFCHNVNDFLSIVPKKGRIISGLTLRKKSFQTKADSVRLAIFWRHKPESGTFPLNIQRKKIKKNPLFLFVPFCSCVFIEPSFSCKVNASANGH